jgi:Caspase domain
MGQSMKVRRGVALLLLIPSLCMAFISLQARAQTRVPKPAETSAVGYNTHRALLIGVTGYPEPTELNGKFRKQDIRLDGPKNDVRYVYEMLTGLRRDGKTLFDPGNITVVADELGQEFLSRLRADGAEVIELPTRANIDAAFKTLRARTADNDFVYIHMSGHGLQAPAQGDDLDLEPDGLDEVFVPIDFGTWKKSDRSGEWILENTITDNEIGAHIAALKQTAFVWIVFDACHSGDMVRAAGDPARTRTIVPRLLGEDFVQALNKSQDMARKKATRSRGLTAETPLGDVVRKQDGKRFVAFYAVQSNQLALEKSLPDAGSPVMGLLTHSLLRAMHAMPEATYQHIAEAVRAEYDRFGGQLQPLFEGDLSKPAFGGGDPERTWIAERSGWDLSLRAGQLNNLSEGSVLAVYPLGGQSQASKLLTYARVTEVKLSGSRLEPIDYHDRKATLVRELPERLSASLVAANVTLRLRVARPPAEDFSREGMRSGAGGIILQALERASRPKQASEKIDVQIVSHNEHADLYLRVLPDRICLVRQVGDCWDFDASKRKRPSASISLDQESTPDALAEKLHQNFYRVAQVLKLLALYRQSVTEPGAADLFGAEKLDLHAHIVRYPHAQERAKDGEKHKCDKDFAPKTDAERIKLKAQAAGTPDDTGVIVTAIHCDILEIRGRNAADHPIDLTLLYIDSEYSITAMPANGTVRLLSGAEAAGSRFRLQLSTWCEDLAACPRKPRPWSTGTEYLLAIAVAQTPGSNHLAADFRSLEQSGVDHERGIEGVRGAMSCQAQGVAQEFCKLMTGLGSGLRGANTMRSSELDRVALQLYRVNVQPPEPDSKVAAAQ